ncbi:MAG: cellulase family glycosylhydrolase [Lachnospiraceae bacterium]|nr:cellulase family glycosylhydrolase [Lachnospiraceae bacterium]
MAVVVLILFAILLWPKGDKKSDRAKFTLESPIIDDGSMDEAGKAVAKASESSDLPNALSEEASDEASTEEVTDEATEDEDAQATESNVPDEEESSEESSDAATEESPKSSAYVLTYSEEGSWEDGGAKMRTLNLSLFNQTSESVKNWTLVLTIEGLKNVSGWNGSYVISGNDLTVTPADYNAELFADGTLYLGCNLGTASNLKITKATLNGKECEIQSGKVDQNAQNAKNDKPSGKQDKNGKDNKDNKNGKTENQQGNNDVEAILKRAEKAEQGDDWLHTDGRRILDKDGKEVWLTGVNWFGYNTGTNVFDGLWNSKLDSTVKAVADHGFNLIRVPMSAQLINEWAAGKYPQANYNQAYNAALTKMNSLEIFEYFLTLAEGNGIKVMIDVHSAETDPSGHNVNLWYTGKVSVEKYYAALEWMAARYKNNDTIIAYDLKNEPHGKPYEGDAAAIWNDSKKANNWKYVAETAASKVLAKNPNVLIMVEGTEIYPKNSKGDYSSKDDKDYYFNWWGGNLRAVKDFPIDLGKYQDKLVYSPHDYGPTVYEQPWFKGNYDYDSLMRDCWHDNWFYIYEDNTAPLLIGEWGGFMREPNLKWMTCMRKLISTYHLNHTFWCLNANSGDTGGLLLDDFTTWDAEKYNFVKEVLWQENGKFVGLDHKIPLGDNGISLGTAKGR